jgi:hypothetical protein
MPTPTLSSEFTAIHRPPKTLLYNPVSLRSVGF